MSKELRLRQGNFGSYSTNRVFLREKMKYDEAKEILGASFHSVGDTSLVSPELRFLDEDEPGLNEYMLDPLILLCAYQIKMILSIGT